jgi:hypothetical protein
MTKMAKICPVRVTGVTYCEKAINEIFTAFSIISRHMMILITFLCVRTPKSPMQKSTADNIRYWSNPVLNIISP